VKFKKGDIVVCIKSGHGLYIKLGHYYTVDECQPWVTLIQITKSHSYDYWRFELAKDLTKLERALYEI
jgi:hypothetical protein